MKISCAQTEKSWQKQVLLTGSLISSCWCETILGDLCCRWCAARSASVVGTFFNYIYWRMGQQSPALSSLSLYPSIFQSHRLGLGKLWHLTRSTLNDLSKLVLHRLVAIILGAHTLRHRYQSTKCEKKLIEKGRSWPSSSVKSTRRESGWALKTNPDKTVNRFRARRWHNSWAEDEGGRGGPDSLSLGNRRRGAGVCEGGAEVQSIPHL